MAEKIVTVGTWEEFKQAFQTDPGSGNYLTISLTKDIECTEQHPLPSKNYWITISNRVSKILGNNHTISNINVPADYKYSYIFKYTSYGSHTVNVYDLKIMNISIPYSVFVGSGNSSAMYFNLYRCTITGIFDFFVTEGNYAVYINQLTSCNIVQMSPRPQDVWKKWDFYFIAENLKYTHYYYTHLSNITAGDCHPASTLDNCYIEINPGLTNLAEHTLIGSSSRRVTLNQSCINCNKKLKFSLDTNKTTATGITILNCTNDPAEDIPTDFANNIKIITDEQMKNADYLNSIGFTVTPTN